MSGDLAILKQSGPKLVADLIPGATRTSLEIDPTVSYKVWEHLGQSLTEHSQYAAAEANSLCWLLGDWWRAGERLYGEQAAQAIDPHNRALQTVRNYAWVCDAIEASRRREDVTFSHHVVVAKMMPTEQSEWLARSAEGGWSVAQLKREIKGITGEEPETPALESGEKKEAEVAQAAAEAPQTLPDDIEIVRNGDAVSEIRSESRGFELKRPSAHAAVLTIGTKIIQVYASTDVVVTVKEAKAKE